MHGFNLFKEFTKFNFKLTIIKKVSIKDKEIKKKKIDKSIY